MVETKKLLVGARIRRFLLVLETPLHLASPHYDHFKLGFGLYYGYSKVHWNCLLHGCQSSRQQKEAEYLFLTLEFGNYMLLFACALVLVAIQSCIFRRLNFLRTPSRMVLAGNYQRNVSATPFSILQPRKYSFENFNTSQHA